MRRAFALLSLVLGAALAACSAPTTVLSLKRYEFAEPQMGVPFRIILYALNEQMAEAAADAAFKRVSELNDIFSDYETDSEVNQLSFSSDTNGPARRVSPELWDVLARAQLLAQRSGGAFDVTIGPVSHLWRKARREGKFPAPALLADARSRVGYESLVLNEDNRTVHLNRQRMRLDLGGIAKGYAVDEALKVLDQRGVTRALVAASGDIAVSGPPPNAKGWTIRLADFDTNAPALSVVLRDRAITTSGDLSQRLEIGGVFYSHIADPRTGVGLTNRVLVTTIGKDCATADSVATALSALGPERGFELLEKYSGLEARITRKIGTQVIVRETSGFKEYLRRKR